MSTNTKSSESTELLQVSPRYWIQADPRAVTCAHPVAAGWDAAGSLNGSSVVQLNDLPLVLNREQLVKNFWFHLFSSLRSGLWPSQISAPLETAELRQDTPHSDHMFEFLSSSSDFSRPLRRFLRLVKVEAALGG